MAPHFPNVDPDPVEPESRSRSALAMLIMGVLLIAVPMMVGLIGYRSIKIHTPSTALVVEGDSSVDGAKIEVTESAEPHRRWVAWISRGDNWQSPILLDPGQYHVSVTHRGTEILSDDFAPDRLYGVRFDLKSMVMIIGNRALADANIEITYTGSNPRIPPSTDIKLTADEHWRHSVYLTAGEYRATARAPGAGHQVLVQTDFSVDHAGPVRIDLGKIYDEGD